MSLMTEAEAEAEAAVIGICLVWPERVIDVDLDPGHFADVRWTSAWAAVRELEAAGVRPDLISVGDYLEKAGKRSMAGELAKAAGAPVTGTNIKHYVSMVRGAWVRRSIAIACSAAVESAKRHDDGDEIVSELLRQLAVIHVEQPGGEQRIKPMVRSRLREIGEMADAKAKGNPISTGICTGIVELDELLGGLQRGVVTVMAGRPGMGKSAAALTVTRHAASQGVGVHVFSLEDTREAYLDRVISGASGVPAEAIRALRLNATQLSDLRWAMSDRFEADPRWLVEDRAGITADEVVRSVRRRLRDNGTRLVIVDYVQLLRAPKHCAKGEEAVTHAMNVLADAAKQDGLAYLVLAQLNRECERRDQKRPLLADLKQAGTIEERAKCAIFLYRPSVYGEIDKDTKRPIDEAVIELLVAKNNQGRTGKAIATWDGPTMRIT